MKYSAEEKEVVRSLMQSCEDGQNLGWLYIEMIWNQEEQAEVRDAIKHMHESVRKASALFSIRKGRQRRVRAR